MQQRGVMLGFWILVAQTMCANEGMFSRLDQTFSHTVKLENSTNMKATRKTVVKLTLHEVRYTISNVYWVHELKNNLLSIGQLQEKGVVVFVQRWCMLHLSSIERKK